MSTSSSSRSDELRRDQWQRWQAGERVLVESYIAKYPELKHDPDALVELVESEFSIRAQLGESPTVDEYYERFPQLVDYFSWDSDPNVDTVSKHPPTSLVCPFCDTKVNLAAGTVESTHCSNCGHEIRILDETVSLYARPGRTLGAFALVRRLGFGQFGEVWLARDSNLQRDVAIKLPRTAGRDRITELFFREARAAAQLRHPNIVSVHEVGFTDEQPYIVAEYISGITLKDRIGAKPFMPREAAKLCRTMAEALHHAHNAGIVHRDLKPSNVLLDLQGVPHIADFGLAKLSSQTELTINTQGQMLGTPAYMPPEQARGEATSAASDVYSLGVIFYEMLSGSRPFDGPMDVLLYRILTDEPPPLRKRQSDLPRDLETICLKCLAKKPADRYSSAQELAEDLGRFLEGEPIRARQADLLERTARLARRYRTVAATLSTAAILLAIVGSLWAGGFFGSEPRLPDGIHPIVPDVPPDPDVKHMVRIVTEPDDAEVVCYPIDYYTGRANFAGRRAGSSRTPVEMELPSGMWLIVAHRDDALFHEVLRIVPHTPEADRRNQRYERWEWDAIKGVVVLPSITLFPHPLGEDSLIPIEGSAKFDIDLSPLGYKERSYRVPDFEIQPTEMTVGQFQRADTTKLIHGNVSGELVAGKLRWGSAVAYAESRGMRLPDLVELEYLISRSGKKYPWGDDPPRADNWDISKPVTADTRDKLIGLQEITGLASRGLEWTSTRTRIGRGNDGAGMRYAVRGRAALLEHEKLSTQAGDWISVNEFVTVPALGVRFARSPRPRLREEDFVESLEAP